MPLAAPSVRTLDAGPRQVDRRRAQARRQRSLALAMPVAGANRADPLRAACDQRRLQFFIDQRLDRGPNPLSHQLLERPVSPPQTPAIALHSVILRPRLQAGATWA